jgi:hypothetical protein
VAPAVEVTFPDGVMVMMLSRMMMLLLLLLLPLLLLLIMMMMMMMMMMTTRTQQWCSCRRVMAPAVEVTFPGPLGGLVDLSRWFDQVQHSVR